MKEQIQTPYDSRGDTTDREKGSKPKALSRPAIAEGLKKPLFDQKWARANLYRHCSCGNKRCTSPMLPNPDWHWIYRDKVTDEEVVHPDLPRFGGDPGDFTGNDAWEHR